MIKLSLRAYNSLCKKVFVDSGGNPNLDRKELIDKVLSEKGSFLKVSDSIKSNTKFKEKNLSWLPYQLGDGKIVLFASNPDEFSNNWCNWNSYLLYVDGRVYQSSATHPSTGKPAPTGISNLYNEKSDTIQDYLTYNGFELVK